MTKNEIRIRAEQIVEVYVPNMHDCHNLVERLCDLIEDVAEFDRDAAFKAGYDEGFVDGQDEEYDAGFTDGFDVGHDDRYGEGLHPI